MSSLERWDHELARLHGEVANFAVAVRRRFGARYYAFGNLKLRVIRKQMDVARMTDEIMAHGENDGSVRSPMETSLLYWSRVYAEKIGKLYEQRSKLYTKMMWLKLIESRLAPRSSYRDLMIDLEEALEVGAKSGDLKRMETVLQDELKKVKAEQDMLSARYHAFEVTQANRGAMSSMYGQLGETLQESLTNPLMLALEGYFQRLCALPAQVSVFVSDQYQVASQRLEQNRLERRRRARMRRRGVPAPMRSGASRRDHTAGRGAGAAEMATSPDGAGFRIVKDINSPPV